MCQSGVAFQALRRHPVSGEEIRRSRWQAPVFTTKPRCKACHPSVGDLRVALESPSLTLAARLRVSVVEEEELRAPRSLERERVGMEDGKSLRGAA